MSADGRPAVAVWNYTACRIEFRPSGTNRRAIGWRHDCLSHGPQISLSEIK